MYKKILKYSIITLTLVTISACTDNSTTSTTSQKEKNEMISKKQNELGTKYNAMMNWEDSFTDQLTIKIQKEMKNKVVLFKNYSLVDVYQQGGSIIAKFDGYDGFYLVLKTTSNSEVLTRLVTDNLKFKSLTVVVDVKDVVVPLIVLDPQDVDGEYIEVEVSTDASKQVSGRLIDFLVEE